MEDLTGGEADLQLLRKDMQRSFVGMGVCVCVLLSVKTCQGAAL